MNKSEKILDSCPVDAFLRIVGQRWSAYILHILAYHRSLRFGQLKREIKGISQKVLTEKLRELEAAKIIYRDYKATVPPQVTYYLTEHGMELIPLLDMIRELAHKWRDKRYL